MIFKQRFARWTSRVVTAENCATLVKVNLSLLSPPYFTTAEDKTSKEIPTNAATRTNPLTGGSSPAARTIKLTFRYPLTPAERSSGSQSRSHFLKKQCPTKKRWIWSVSNPVFLKCKHYILTSVNCTIYELTVLIVDGSNIQLENMNKRSDLFAQYKKKNACLYCLRFFGVICTREVHLEFTNHSISPEGARVAHLQRTESSASEAFGMNALQRSIHALKVQDLQWWRWVRQTSRRESRRSSGKRSKQNAHGSLASC